MSVSTKKTPTKGYTNDSLIEQLRDVGRGVSRNLTQDLVSGVTSDALSSLFGTPQSGDMKPGQAVSLEKNQPDVTQSEMPEMPFPWRRRAPEAPRTNVAFNESLNRLRQEEALVAQKIEEIRMELKALIAALKMVDKQIQKAVDEELVDPGVYHLTFLDRLKTILRLLRKNLTDSSSWLAVMHSRKKEKRYWNQYKRKGTTFGLSHERVVSTQVG